MAGKCPAHGNPIPFDDDYFFSPYPTYAALHEAGGAHRVCDVDESPQWIVTRYEDVRDGLRDARLARNPSYAGPDYPGDALPEDLLDACPLISDPPEYTRLRRFINFAFIPRRVNALLPRITEVVDGLLDGVAEDGKTDLMGALASALPITIICDMLGVPPELRADFRSASEAMLTGTEEEAGAAFDPLVTMLAGLIERRQADPEDDLISHWSHWKNDDGSPALSFPELLSMSFFTLIAGFETTAGTLGNALANLLRNPEKIAELRADPSLYPDAVEELIRFDGSVQSGVRRFAVEDMEIGGCPVKAGDVVTLSLGAAGRDPRRFPEPDELDFHRENKQHLGFGLGPHVCPGMELGRAQVRVALRALFERFPDIRLAAPADELRWRHSNFIRVLQELPVIV